MRAVILAAAVVLAGCDVASSALGRDAMLQVDGAQWRPGPRPDDDGGPTVSEVLLRRPTVVRDGLGQRVTGALAPSATGLWLGADGDVGGWIVTADAPSVERPGDPSFAVAVAVTAAARQCSRSRLSTSSGIAFSSGGAPAPSSESSSESSSSESSSASSPSSDGPVASSSWIGPELGCSVQA